MSKTLVKRMRRKAMGGRIDMRIYSDGSMHVRCDHPSNDPEVELAMGGRVIKLARKAFADLGLEVKVGPMRWRDDPPKYGEGEVMEA